MPIEIRELVIKTTIDNSGGSTGNNINEKQMKHQLDKLKKDIIAECLAQIEEKIERNTER